jgi:riboflavin synthase alpha subunit
MKTSGRDINSFEGYADALGQLELSFRSANVPVKFYLFVAALNNKMVEITYKNRKPKKLVCIEGDSIAQAVKNIAAAVET